MTDGPDLPVIALARGQWRANVFDPRPAPLALGARYVHGCYVSELMRGSRCLTGRASERWDPYVGQGLPEVFEFPLGWGGAAEGEQFLRIGAGRLIRSGRSYGSGGLPVQGVEWQLLHVTGDSVAMSCRDSLVQGKSDIGYELVREVRLLDDGLASTTTLTLHVPWNHPITWFAHPFFAQTAGNATAFGMPPGAQPDAAAARDQHGLWRLGSGGGLSNVTALWGSSGAVTCRLDERLGGGAVEVAVNRPMDHLVLYASPSAASPEPQLARSWQNGETASWTVTYRWLGDPTCR